MTMNLKNIILQSLFLISPALLWAQGGIVNNGASIRITNSANLKINAGGVINNDNGNINNEGNLSLDLNWVQSGVRTNYSGAGWMTFEGNTPQNLSSPYPITIPMLRVNNRNHLILKDDITVSDRVDLTNNGSIELGTNNLVLTANATILNFDASHFIITNSTGALQQEVGATDVVFPIGNSTYNPATLNNIGTLDNFSARVEDQVVDFNTKSTPETQDFVNRSWHITEAVTGGSSSTLTVQWDSPQELPGFDRTQSSLAHLNDQTEEHTLASTAEMPFGTSLTQSKAGIRDFYPFVVKNLNKMLPVELLVFETQRLDNNEIQLSWDTKSETNNQGFHVERMLDTETTFQAIEWVDGAGDNTSLLNYTLHDINPHQGISYYRLKQIDFDGSYTYSSIRAVDGSKLTDNSSILIYPVPTKDHLMIDFSHWENDNADAVLKILDVHGRTLVLKKITMEQSRLIRIDEVSNFVPGTYFVTIGNEETSELLRKIVKY